MGIKGGYIKVYRKLLRSDFWLDEKPFSRGQAWIDLVGLANWEVGRIRVHGVVVEVQRGQVPVSEQTLAKRWGWSRGKIRRFKNELEMEQQIVQQNTSTINLVSITNYEKYNPAVQQTVQQTVPQTDTTKKKEEEYIINSSTSKDVNGASKNLSEKEERASRAKKRTLITSVALADRPKAIAENLVPRSVYWLYDTLAPLHNNKRVFREAKLEKWLEDMKLVFGAHKRNPEEFKKLVKWAIDNDEATYIMSPNFFAKNAGKNYDLWLSKMEQFNKKDKNAPVTFKSKVKT